MSSNELLTKFPEALIIFLEDQLEFDWPQRDPLKNNLLTNFAEITMCTNQAGEDIKYLLSRNGNLFLRVIPSRLAVVRVPDLIVGFLESKLDFTDSKVPNNKRYCEFFFFNFVPQIFFVFVHSIHILIPTQTFLFPATRYFQNQVTALNVSLFPKVKVGRSLAFERHLLTGPQAPRAAPLVPNRISNVPIGARGRKRKTIMYVGVVPNPDGRKLATPAHQQAPESPIHQPANLDGHQNANESGSQVRQPAKRTYARAGSTPFPSGSVNHRPRARGR